VSSCLPPRFATWLLERLGRDSRVDPLIGDLAEQFAKGRSRLWYWRQASGALALDLFRGLRLHGLSFTAAVLAGCAFSTLWHLASSWALQPMYQELWDANRHPGTVAGLLPFTGLLANAVSNCVLSFASVWVVTRIHRAHRRAVLVAFVIALTAQQLPAITRLALELARDSQVVVALNIAIVMTALQAVFTLVAGLWSFRPGRFADLDRRTRFVSIGVAALVTVASVLYSAWRVGALSYSRTAGYFLDAAEIASGAYLAFLLWRLTSAARVTKHPPTLPSAAHRRAAPALW
jgi:hypothetical protein